MSFAAYLRGFETQNETRRTERRLGSQPTYEGLKPQENRALRDELLGSQPTYEGLKLAELARACV